MKRVLLTIISLLCVTLFAGDLDDFEKKIRTKPDYDTESEYNSSSSGDGCNDGCADALCLILAATTEDSEHSHSYDEPDYSEPEYSEPDDYESDFDFNSDREPGDFLMPMVRLDSNYSYINSDLYSINNRIEGGYKYIGAALEFNLYNERNPKDTLKQFGAVILIRLKLEVLEIIPAMGYSSISNNDTTEGFKLGSIIRFSPVKYFGFELRPYAIMSGFNTLYDIDMSIYGGNRHWGITLGYRYLGNENASMDGFYTGIRLFY